MDPTNPNQNNADQQTPQDPQPVDPTLPIQNPTPPVEPTPTPPIDIPVPAASEPDPPPVLPTPTPPSPPQSKPQDINPVGMPSPQDSTEKPPSSNTQPPTEPINAMSDGSSSKKTIVGLSVVAILFLLGGATLYVFQNYDQFQSQPNVRAKVEQPIVPATMTPTPTPGTEEEKEVLNLQISDPSNEVADIQSDIQQL